MSYSKKMMEGCRSLTLPVYSKPKSVQQTIPIYRIAEDGVFQIEKKKENESKRFDKAYIFVDTNYSIKNIEEREDFLNIYCQFLNSLNVSFKIVIMNNNQNMEHIRRDVFIRNSESDFAPLVNDINQNIENGIQKGRNGIDQVKLFVITCDRQNVEHARDFFRTIEANLKMNFGRLESALIPLDARERLRYLHSFYRMGKEEEYHFNFEDVFQRTTDWRNLICSLSIRYHKDEAGKLDGETLECDGRFVRVLFVRELPNSIADDFVQMLTAVSFHTITTIDVAPIPTQVARKRLMDLYMGNGRSIDRQQEQRNKVRAYSSEITYDKRKEKEEIESYLDILTKNDEKLFYMGLYITVTAATKKALESNVLSLYSIAANQNIELEPALYDQLRALHTSLPLGARHCNAMQPVFTQPLCAFVPFNVQELHDKGGFYYGINQVSKNIIIGKRKNLDKPHGFVLGSTGGGKGFETKNEMVQVVLRTKDDIITIDPQNEYQEIARTLKGEFINISASSGNYINPLDPQTMDNFDSREAFVADKTELMLGIAEQILKRDITMGQKSIVGRCVGIVYRDYFVRLEQKKGIFSKPAVEPTMREFYEAMKSQEEEEAQNLKLAFELFVEGALNIFSKPSNVDIKNRFVVFGTNELGNDLASVGQLIMLESIRSRIANNARKGIATWLYIDEFHNLAGQAFSASYLEKIWKEVRKFGGICTGVTQNIADLLRTKEVETMLCNSGYISLLAQSEIELPILSQALGLNSNLLEYVHQSEKGHGLLKFGNKYIPKSNEIPKGTPLYDLFNTDFHEKQKQMLKKREIKRAVAALPSESQEAALYSLKAEILQDGEGE